MSDHVSRFVRLLAVVLVSTALPAVQALAARAATFTVNSTADAVDANPGDGVCEAAPGGGVCTLRAAVLEANALPGADVILLPAGDHPLTIGLEDFDPGTDTPETGDLDVTEDLEIHGAGSAVTAVSGSFAGVSDRLLDVAAGATVEVTGVTLRNGFLDSGDGAGIRNAGTLTLVDIPPFRASSAAASAAGSRAAGR